MLKNMMIGKRLGMAFGLLLALMVAVAGAGYWGTRAATTLALRVLKTESPIVDLAQQARAHTLGLRRFEKDVFLNIGDAAKVDDYATKWNGQRTSFEERLTALDQLETDTAGQQTLATMRQEMAAYLDGFNRVLAEIRAGRVKTPADANQSITPYKDGIRRLEDTANAYAAHHSAQMIAEAPAVAARAARATPITLVVTRIAAAIGLGLSVVITRTIT